MAVTSTYIPLVNVMPGARFRASAASDTSLITLSGAGAPTVNVTGLGVAVVGSEYVDTTNGILYICTATNGTSTITWTKVGTQT